MSRRNRRGGGLDNVLSLDSLVDVVTNTNGILLLMASLTVLLALGKTYKVDFPAVTPSEKQAVFLECVEGRVYFITSEGDYSDAYYLTPLSGAMMVTRKPDAKGFGEADLRDPGSAFWRRVSEIDRDRQYAAVLVRPSGFEIFRAVRSELRGESISVGWEPKESGEAIIFGSGGIAIGTQD